MPLPYPLPTIPATRLCCTLVAEERATLPAYKGSLLRGAFGHALRRAVCAMGPAQPCETCRLRRACVYTRIFETFVEGPPPPLLRGLATAPRPYVIEPAGETRDFAPGDRLGFDLLLFGQATELAAYALLAIERMAAAGLGRDRFRFRLAEVETPATEEGFDGRGRTRATLRFTTPTRLQSRDGLQPRVGFRALAFAMLRRTLEIAHLHVPGAAAGLDWSFQPLLDQASTIQVTASRLDWHDWERYSNRQGRKMTLGGFVGEMEVAGDLEPWTALLRQAEILHVGKGATFGLGRLQVAAAPG